MSSLDGKTILIAGCRPGGLGVTIGMACEQAGARIFYTAKRPSLYQAMIRTGRYAPGNSEVTQHIADRPILECDVTKPETVSKLFCDFQDGSIKLDGFVYSVAGGAESVIGTDMLACDDDFHTSFQINCVGFIRMISEGFEHSVWANGASALALSFDCKRTYRDYGNMGPMKAYLEKWVRDYATRAPNEMRLNVLSAGPIETISGKAISNFGLIQQFYEDRVGWSEEKGRPLIAKGAIELLGHSFATGLVCYADGGMNDLLHHHPAIFDNWVQQFNEEEL